MPQSHAQKTRGIPLPAQIVGHPTICVQFECPDVPEYRAAVMGQVFDLSKWYTWEKDGTHRAVEAAALWRQLLHDTFTFKDSCESDDNRCEDEDILEDVYQAMMDGVLSNTLIGGVTKAIGYALDEAGRVITETVLPVIGLTLVGLAVGALAAVIVGGVTIGTVAVAAGETVEILVATGATVAESKIIELVALAAAA